MPGVTKDIEIGIDIYHPTDIKEEKPKIFGFINKLFQPITFVSYDPNLRKEDNNC